LDEELKLLRAALRSALLIIRSMQSLKDPGDMAFEPIYEYERYQRREKRK